MVEWVFVFVFCLGAGGWDRWDAQLPLDHLAAFAPKASHQSRSVDCLLWVFPLSLLHHCLRVPLYPLFSICWIPMLCPKVKQDQE